MTYYKDLDSIDLYGRWEDLLIGVGWLDTEHEYTRGAVSTNFFEALVELLVDPWQPGAFAGRSPCPMCRFTGGPGSMAFHGRSVVMGASNLFVPGAPTGVYVAPSLIAHFIDAHEYAPPVAFQEAVLQCPTMGSFEYRKAMLARGIRQQRDSS